MDISIPPVVRGEFVYRDALFVDVGGEGKRHTRAYESELKDLLNGKASKDQVAHWSKHSWFIMDSNAPRRRTPPRCDSNRRSIRGS